MSVTIKTPQEIEKMRIAGKLVDAGAQLDAAPTRTPFWLSPASSPSSLHDHRVPGAGRPAMIA